MSHVNTRASLPGGDIEHIKNQEKVTAQRVGWLEHHIWFVVQKLVGVGLADCMGLTT